MSSDILDRAHRIYELEGDRVARLIAQDPNYADLALGLEAMAEQAAAKMGTGPIEQMARAHRLMMDIIREHAFKLGFVMAHTYDLDEASEM